MIPLFLDPAKSRIGLIGRGELAARRLKWLRAGRARPQAWSDDPEAALIGEAGADLIRRLPTEAELRTLHAVWIADLPRDVAAPLADAARAAGVLVNVEDVVDLCDFHTPAVVRRGKLTLAAGTGGASPAATRAVREKLEATFPESWGEALSDIERSRIDLRKQGAGLDALSADARARLAQHGLA